jgi:hypothetical protein
MVTLSIVAVGRRSRWPTRDRETAISECGHLPPWRPHTARITRLVNWSIYRVTARRPSPMARKRKVTKPRTAVLTVSVHPTHNAVTAAPWTSSSNGIVPNHGSPSAGPWSSVTACTWNPATSTGHDQSAPWSSASIGIRGCRLRPSQTDRTSWRESAESRGSRTADRSLANPVRRSPQRQTRSGFCWPYYSRVACVATRQYPLKCEMFSSAKSIGRL